MGGTFSKGQRLGQTWDQLTENWWWTGRRIRAQSQIYSCNLTRWVQCTAMVRLIVLRVLADFLLSIPMKFQISRRDHSLIYWFLHLNNGEYLRLEWFCQLTRMLKVCWGTQEVYPGKIYGGGERSQHWASDPVLDTVRCAAEGVKMFAL